MINIIVAMADNGVIGDNNSLIWHIAEDLKRFKRITTGHAIVMGRKTYESIGRPLPNRRNVVVTRDENFNADGVDIFYDLDEALELGLSDDIFVIGGGQIYAQTLKRADKFFVTHVHQNPSGDTKFPDIDWKNWVEVAREDTEKCSFVDYERATDK